MGLLDDAIREHLELKRLRGADPGEVAREQREALDPVPREGHEGHDHEPAPPAEVLAEDPSAAGSPAGAVAANELGEAQVARDADFSNVGQETAELDMRTVLGEERDASGHGGGEAAHAGTADAGGEAPAQGRPEEDSLEWEMPAGASGTQAADVGGGESAGSAGAKAEAHGDERQRGGVQGDGVDDGAQSAEDVLEETPDFLRDTPEQERLWFEQRPPRDFDFDK
jgi:hypothetical protein